MTGHFYLRYMFRESRGARGRLIFFVACLAVGVAAVVAVAALASSLDRAIRAEAKQLLAADLVVEGRRPLPEELAAALVQMPHVQRTDVKEMVTVVAVPGRQGQPGASQLVEVKAVDGDYPFYGRLGLEPDMSLSELLDERTVVAAPELLSRLGLDLGDALRVGGEEFHIAARVVSEPDRIDLSLAFGPRLFLDAQGLRRAGLERYGSRIRYRALLRLPPGAGIKDAEAVADELKKALPAAGFFNVETYAEAQPALRRGLARAERFLGLVALVSLLVGGVGVAQTVRAWLAGRLEAIAVIKCLGIRPREVMALYLGQAALLGCVGSGLGALAGIGVVLLVPVLLGDLIPSHLVHPWQPHALIRGSVLGLGVALLFSLPPLATVRRVSPAVVFRREAEPLPATRWAAWITGLLLLAGVTGMATVQSGSLARGSRFTAGLALATGLLYLAAQLVRRLVRVVPRSADRLWLRHGLAALDRPGAGTTGAIVALGVGVLVVLGMSLVEEVLSTELDADLPRDAPSIFLIDVQPDQWSAVETLLRREGAAQLQAVPVLMTRLEAINGRSVDELVAEAPENRRRRWALTREQRLTYMADLPDDNAVVEGELWSDPARPEISVETGFADDLDIGLGTLLRFDIQGVPVELTVTSLRTVEWDSFRINFFLVAEPGVLEEAPQLRMASAQLPRDREQHIQDLLTARFPNVTTLPLRQVLDKILAVLERIGFGVRFLGGFTVLAGIAILAGTVSASSVRRGREVALLKTLGMTRLAVVTVFAVEYALLGLVAGLIGALGGGVLAWAVLTRGMEIGWSFHAAPYAVAVLAASLLTVTAGLAASLRALSQRPIEVLRAE
jgi:putative ABC transport system permease protein